MENHREEKRARAQAYWSSTAGHRIGHLRDVTLSTDVGLNEIRLDLEDEIYAARVAVSAMQERRNALAPISKLPPEVLTRVFEYVSQASAPRAGDIDEGTLPSLGWIPAATHVCRHWREVAVDCATLWAQIALDVNAELAEEMLLRAKGAPLYIEKKLDNRIAYRGQELGGWHLVLPTHLFHVRELTLSSSVDYIKYMIPSLMRPVPILEKLDLSFQPIIPYQSPILLPSDIFDGQMPRLRDISLQGLVIRWDTFPAASLTHLNLSLSRHLNWDQRDVISPLLYSQFLDFLDKQSGLKYLNLDHSVPPHSGITSDRVVKMTQLVELGLTGRSLEIINLLTHLETPSSTNLHLTCVSWDVGSTIQDCLLILPIVSARLKTHTDNPVPIRTLSASAFHDHSLGSSIDIRAQAEYIESTASPQVFDPTDDAFISLSLDFNGEIPLHALKVVFDSFPLSMLVTLSMRLSTPDWTAAQWSEVFRGCSLVQHLQVADSAGLDVFNAIMPMPAQRHTEHTSDHSPSELLFPKLHSLYLQDVDFIPREQDDGPYPPFTTLTTALKRRRRCGASLKLLGVERCLINDPMAARLEKLVDVIVWDWRRMEIDLDSDDSDSDDMSL